MRVVLVKEQFDFKTARRVRRVVGANDVCVQRHDVGLVGMYLDALNGRLHERIDFLMQQLDCAVGSSSSMRHNTEGKGGTLDETASRLHIGHKLIRWWLRAPR